MTKSEFVSTSIENGIGNLTFRNPGKHNALPQSGWEAIPVGVQSLLDDDARVILVSGDGPSFCAGADISEFDVVRRNAETARVYEKTNVDAFAALREASVPVIAKITGYCLGGGFGLAAACDIRFTDMQAQFGVPAAKLGLAYPVSAMADIVHALGTQRTKEILFSAERYSAPQMHGFGFTSRVLSADELDKYVQSVATSIAENAPLTHRATKAAIAAALGGDIENAQQIGDVTFTSADYAEGRAAFREKRKPQFQGR